MILSGLHILLTYQCTYECDHCFVWGSPRQKGVFSLTQIEQVLDQTQKIDSINTIYFEGGEPFLYYPILVKAVLSAKRLGFQVGIVSNAYWAVSKNDASAWLQPFVGHLDDLSISSDLFHASKMFSDLAHNAQYAAADLGISTGTIHIANPAYPVDCQNDTGSSEVMYRGRAAENLTQFSSLTCWEELNNCPYEDLIEPGRLHLDPLGYLHICQGISIGNVFDNSISEICGQYNPDQNPVINALVNGGPAELVRRYSIPHDRRYADACHLCYLSRLFLRNRFPDILTPDQMYGILE